MAGGKLSPRQKMINLMYLVFIAMLALNMSKEVLSAFGLMDERLTTSNMSVDDRNQAFMDNLAIKASEQPEQYGTVKEDADKIHKLAEQLDDDIQEIKVAMMEKVKDPQDYEVQDKPDFLNQLFFQGDKLSPDGQAFVDKINDFKTGIVSIIGDKYPSLVEDIETKFSTEEVERRDGIKSDWLKYHFEGFPLVASRTKLTQMQNDIKTTESEILSRMLAGQQEIALSFDNYTTLLESERSAYFSGDPFEGAIVLGRKDAATRPNEVELTLDGRKLTEGADYTIEDGRVVLNVSAGNPGDHKIEGNLIFMEDGEPTPVGVNASFTTISKPTDATISADKMNVVYRGVENPLTISMAGVSDANISASAPGLRKVSGSSYSMNVTTVQGREVKINVTGTIDGKDYPSSATFRIKEIPAPVGTVRKESGIVKMQKNNLAISTIGAELPDFDFDLELRITEFKFNVPGRPTVVVSGNKLDQRAKDELNRARRGETVQIFDIKAQIVGNSSYLLPKVSPVFVELTN